VKVDKRFPIQVLIAFVSGLSAALVVLTVMNANTTEIITAFFAGAVMSALNVLVGFLAIEFTFEKSHTAFLQAVLGGMGIRLMAMLGVLVLLIKYVGLHAPALVVSVLFFYVIYLILEILYIQNKVSHKGQ
jgi:hypothetical protein